MSYTENQEDQVVAGNFNVNGEKKEFRCFNKESMAKDLHFLFFLFAQRGCNVAKVRAKSNGWGTTLNPKIITIPRLTACFPTCFADVYHGGFAKSLVSLADLAFEQAISKAMLCPMIVCISPLACVDLARNCSVPNLKC